MGRLLLSAGAFAVQNLALSPHQAVGLRLIASMGSSSSRRETATSANGESNPVNTEAVLQSLRELGMKDLETVKRQLFFDPSFATNLSITVEQQLRHTSAADEEQELIRRARSESPRGQGTKSSSGSYKIVRSDPAVMNRPTMARKRSMSPKGLKRAKSTLTQPVDWSAKERDVVVVSSLSLDWEELAKVPGVTMYELRLLWHLYLLKKRDIRMVFCTSQHVPEELVNYYLQYLPSGTVESARERLLMLSCNDQRALSVTEKLLSRNRAVQRIKDFVDLNHAYMTCFNSTDSEVALAQKIGVPLIGNGNDVAFWGTKAGNRQVFRDAGVLHPDGSYDSSFDASSLAQEVVKLWRRYPDIKKIMVKLNESFSGEGNAILRTTPELRETVLNESMVAASGAVEETFQSALEFVAPCETWPHYHSQIMKLGAICEAFVEGPADKKTSPSCQLFISEKGQVKVFATHEQWLDGQIYVGCHFPADLKYASQLCAKGAEIGNALAKKGVVGYCAVDFVSIELEDGSFEHHAIEVNVRMGGTTLPIMTLDLLCKSGRFDATTSEYIASDGTPRYYTASDTIRKPQYRGLITHDLMDIVKKHSASIEWNQRPGAPETGVVFHLVPLLSELGKVGAVCIGRTREEARQLFDKVTEILDQETAEDAGGSNAEFNFAMSFDEPDAAERLN